MTTKDFIKKALQVIGKKLIVTDMTFQQKYQITDYFGKDKTEEQMYLTVFYKKADGTNTNFTVNTYDWSDNYGAEQLLLELKKELVGMEEVKTLTPEPEIESALSK